MNKEDYRQLDRRILRILIPAILENALLTLAGMVLTGYIGRLAVDQISSFGIANRIYNIYFAIFKGFSIGGMIILARSFGRKDNALCAKLQKINYATVLPLSLLATCFITLKAEMLLGIMTEDAELIRQGAAFMRITIWTYPLVAMVHLNSAAFQADGDTRTPLFIATIGNIVNIIVGYVLIFGFGPIRPMYLTGAAISQNIEYVIMFLVGIYLLYGKNGKFKGIESSTEADTVATALEIIRTGIPAAIESSFWSTAMVFFSIIVLSYGSEVYASLQLGLQAEGFVDMMAAGFMTASLALSSNAVGARDSTLYKNAYKRISHYGFIICIINTLYMIFLSRPTLRALTDKPELIAIGMSYMTTMIWSQYPALKQKIAIGYLKSAGMVRTPMVITFIGIFVARLFTAYIFAYVLHLGIVWIWWTMNFDQWFRDLAAEGIFKYKRVLYYLDRE